MNEPKTTVAYSIDNREDHWAVECPECDLTAEYNGWFDSGEKYTCLICKTEFYATHLGGDGWTIEFERTEKPFTLSRR